MSFPSITRGASPTSSLISQGREPRARQAEQAPGTQVMPSIDSSANPLMPKKIHTGIDYGANAMTAPVSSARELPVIDRSKVDPEVLKAAEGMETMFLDYMMKVMRQTVPKNELDMESPATEIYRGMLDSEYAQKAAKHGGIGLSDQIIAYLEARRYNLPEGQGVSGRAVSPKVAKPPVQEEVRQRVTEGAVAKKEMP